MPLNDYRFRVGKLSAIVYEQSKVCTVIPMLPRQRVVFQGWCICETLERSIQKASIATILWTLTNASNSLTLQGQLNWWVNVQDGNMLPIRISICMKQNSNMVSSIWHQHHDITI